MSGTAGKVRRNGPRTLSFESEVGAPDDRTLLLRGLVALAAIVVVVAGLLLKSNGAFDDRVRVDALMYDVGDGLPAKSDVKFRGMLVGMVTGVTPGTNGRPHVVHLSLKPAEASGIPKTVTARVVPSNVFAVSSVQLVDNGTATPVRSGGQIKGDTGEATVQLQTALTRIRDIVAAVGRDRNDDTVGLMAALASATAHKGSDIRTAGGQLVDIVAELNTVLTASGERSMLTDLDRALRGLRTSAPDLLEALNASIVPMRTAAEKQAQLTEFLAGGQRTLGTSLTALQNNTDRIITITKQTEPVLKVAAAGGPQMPGIMTRLADLSNTFMKEFWKPERQAGTGFFVLSMTPHTPYTRAQCPRYGELKGASCDWAPESFVSPKLPENLDPKNYQVPPGLIGGNVGSVGSKQEMDALRELLGGADASTLLILAPLLRGTNVTVAPGGK